MKAGVINAITIQVLCYSCINLQHVHDFSDYANAATKRFNDIHYTFTQHCIDRCRMAAIDSAAIRRDIPCPCDIYKRADSLTLSLYDALSAYFDGLTKLAANKSTTYSVSRLQKAVRAEDLGVIQMNKEEADAYSTLLDIVLRSVADSYRQRRIKAYITEANAPVQVLLSKLDFIETRNIHDLLEVRKEWLFDHYRNLLKNRLSEYEKQKAATDYYESLEAVRTIEKEIASYSRSLKAIARGHQKVYDNRHTISGKEMRRVLLPYINDLRDLISEFDKLNSK